ncbi:MAG: hypothetical protein H6551_09255 [Chitinophagales bacterium]|nr:hypothetical protein [Chitinophagaceae bacterium]MCB9065309.1 hypothetical protein [Chitinophagales bacterium]
MRYISAICLTAALSFASFGVYAQGDSDPGLTKVGAMRNTSALMINEFDYENQRAHLSFSHTFAKGERDAKLNISSLDARIPMFGMFSGGYFDVQVPIVSISGELGKTWGLGDVNFAYTHMFLGKEDWAIQGTGGLKIGMGTANLLDGKTRPLPMSYQPGQGSTDFMVGGSVTWKKYVTAAAGYQQAFVRYNENDFFAANALNDTIYSRNVYPIARKLHRFGDVMLRLEGHYYTDRAGVTIGAVGLYHVKNDLYEDRNTGNWYEITGSKGFTLNMVGNGFVRFGRHGEYKLDLTVAAPFPNSRRDVIADGTAKEWYVSPRFTFFLGSKKGSLMF